MDFITEYHFTGIPGLRCDLSGNFYFNDRPIKKRWRPGQIFLQINKKRISIKLLRKLAVKKEVELYPF